MRVLAPQQKGNIFFTYLDDIVIMPYVLVNHCICIYIYANCNKFGFQKGVVPVGGAVLALFDLSLDSISI